MIKEKIKFETLTPLYTGSVDARKMKEIQPASIMGSLRFWFDVICHFSGINDNFKYDDKKKKKLKIYEEYLKIRISDEVYSDLDICRKLMLMPTEYYFGTTGWKSRIGIEKMTKFENNIESEFRNNDFNDSLRIGGQLRISTGNVDRNGNPKDSCWFIPYTYYNGKFMITFTTEDKKIKDNILFPLLNFIQEYGFLGGKNNIGFGRVKIAKPVISRNFISINPEKIGINSIIDPKIYCYNPTNFIKEILEQKNLQNNQGIKDLYSILNSIPKKVKIISIPISEIARNESLNETQYKLDDKSLQALRYIKKNIQQEHNNNFLNIIQHLLSKKAKLREAIQYRGGKIPNYEFNNWKKLRHKIFGSTRGKDAEAAKIIPFIKNENGKLIGNLISYAGILSMKGDKHE